MLKARNDSWRDEAGSGFTGEPGVSRGEFPLMKPDERFDP
jgi:hypothetical protein